MTNWREISRLRCAVWFVKDAGCVEGVTITSGLSGVDQVWPMGQPCPSRSPRPHGSRPRVSVGQSGERWWLFACHSRESHGTRVASANRQCVHQPHAPVATSGALTCTTSPQSFASPAPPRCRVRMGDHGEWQCGSETRFQL